MIAALLKSHPQASQRELAVLAKCSRGAVQKTLAKLKSGQTLADAPRSGRPQSLRGEAMARAMHLGLQSPVGSSRTVSEQLASEGFPEVHASTVCRAYRRAGVRYGMPRKALLISQKNKVARVAFATKHGSGRTDFRKVMFTDSKIFVLDKAGGKVWYMEGSRPTVCLPKTSIKVHVYYGVTYFGATKPIFVTGGGSQRSKVLNLKTQVPLRGVGAQEYSQDVLPSLLEDGDRLFSRARSSARKWIFQQDNAPAHTSKMSKGVLEARMSGRWMQDWPACSPDLSWIENVWAWADGRVRQARSNIRTVEEFRSAIEKVFRELPVAHCHNYVQGMQNRLSLVKKEGGGPIGR